MSKKRNVEGIPNGSCVCSQCREEKDNLEYSWYNKRKTKDGFRLQVNTLCRSCINQNRLELKEIRKKAPPRPTYGEKCGCCKRPVYKNKKSIPSGVDGRWSWQCDHDHTTKEFRGWICKSCNTGIGGIGDNIESAQNVLNYLQNKP